MVLNILWGSGPQLDEPTIPQAPLLKPEPVDGRKALAGTLFVLKSGIPWAMLPKKMGCGSGMTSCRRLRDWQRSEAWLKVHRVLLDRLGRANAIDWGRCSLDSASSVAKRGGEGAGSNPTDRGKP